MSMKFKQCSALSKIANKTKTSAKSANSAKMTAKMTAKENVSEAYVWVIVTGTGMYAAPECVYRSKKSGSKCDPCNSAYSDDYVYIAKLKSQSKEIKYELQMRVIVKEYTVLVGSIPGATAQFGCSLPFPFDILFWRGSSILLAFPQHITLNHWQLLWR